MGCPGQTRTIPRRSQPSQRCRETRRTAAARRFLASRPTHRATDCAWAAGQRRPSLRPRCAASAHVIRRAYACGGGGATMRGGTAAGVLEKFFFLFFDFKILRSMQLWHNYVLKDPSLCSDTTVCDNGGSGSRFPGAQRKLKIFPEKRAWLRLVSRGNRHFKRYAAVDRQSSPRSESIFLRQSALEDLTDFSTNGNSSARHSEQVRSRGGGRRRREA
ncbi:hypothetical protein F511_42669 [Dorcoceras hygrometricum]|uniref:Uncharacterized protein n=1 Tax=Dorcoceras hygrometricum TaxID=472368 RepID=A0A2Z7AY36_9LAMI|nr:hypothetical protein F511_42669 [Dorcoceras hygrometricum]